MFLTDACKGTYTIPADRAKYNEINLHSSSLKLAKITSRYIADTAKHI
jgi:hypothetical protein